MSLRRSLLRILVTACLVVLATGPAAWTVAHADTYPSQRVVIIVPVPPGGGTEGFARSPPAGSAEEKELFRKSARFVPRVTPRTATHAP